MTININELRRLARQYVGMTAWSPTSPKELIEILDRLEAAERSDAESVTMYRKARDERDALRAENETLAANLRGKHSTAGATYAHLIAERDALRAAVRHEADCVEACKSEIDALRAKLETAENDAAHQKALAASALRVAEGWERKCRELRAKIKAMEKQEPVAWCAANETGTVVEALSMNQSRRFDTPLGFLPGAKGDKK